MASPCSFKRKEAFMREISYVLYVHALMTRQSCSVGMRNAILRNYLKFKTLLMCGIFRDVSEKTSSSVANVKR